MNCGVCSLISPRAHIPTKFATGHPIFCPGFVSWTSLSLHVRLLCCQRISKYILSCVVQHHVWICWRHVTQVETQFVVRDYSWVHSNVQNHQLAPSCALLAFLGHSHSHCLDVAKLAPQALTLVTRLTVYRWLQILVRVVFAQSLIYHSVPLAFSHLSFWCFCSDASACNSWHNG